MVRAGQFDQHVARFRSSGCGSIVAIRCPFERLGLDSPGHRIRHAAPECPTNVTISSADDLRALIREVPDFPKPGIRFYDITTLLKEPDAFREVIDRMAAQVGDTKIDVVVGMESRGFIFSAPLAYKLNAGFVPVRKLGKLPAETIEVEYELEYGTATLEIHSDAIGKGQRVLIVDDLLATGGTVMGTIELVRRLGGEIAGLSFMVELSALNGRDKLDEFDIHTLLTY
jgi:adenine phosphoribosyltransferase